MSAAVTPQSRPSSRGRAPMRTRQARLAPTLLMATLLAAPLLSGCASDPGSSGLFSPYRFDIPQGNYITQQSLDQVKPGMTREQVRFILGSPLLQSAFQSNRWDYVYRFQHANGESQVRRVLVSFKDDRVESAKALDPLPRAEDNQDPALPGYRPPKTSGPSTPTDDAAKPAQPKEKSS